MQNTIQTPVATSGICLHSGLHSNITLKPGKVNQGIIFIRKDLPSDINIFSLSYKNILCTNLCTSLTNDAAMTISTIEHLCAAIWALDIDNITIELDGSEVPILDGSSKAFVELLIRSGKLKQNAKKSILQVNRKIHVEGLSGSSISIKPSDNFSIDLEIEFNHPLIQKQIIYFNGQKQEFIDNISNARTFGFKSELEYLNKHNLALGASLDNVIALSETSIINEEGLRYKDEFVRHKLLDMLGDFRVASGQVLGHIKASRPSHKLNNELLHKLFSSPLNYSYI